MLRSLYSGALFCSFSKSNDVRITLSPKIEQNLYFWLKKVWVRLFEIQKCPRASIIKWIKCKFRAPKMTKFKTWSFKKIKGQEGLRGSGKIVRIWLLPKWGILAIFWVKLAFKKSESPNPLLAGDFHSFSPFSGFRCFGRLTCRYLVRTVQMQ